MFWYLNYQQSKHSLLRSHITTPMLRCILIRRFVITWSYWSTFHINHSHSHIKTFSLVKYVTRTSNHHRWWFQKNFWCSQRIGQLFKLSLPQQQTTTRNKIDEIVKWISYTYQKGDKEQCYAKAEEFTTAVFTVSFFLIKNSFLSTKECSALHQ